MRNHRAREFAASRPQLTHAPPSGLRPLFQQTSKLPASRTHNHRAPRFAASRPRLTHAPPSGPRPLHQQTSKLPASRTRNHRAREFAASRPQLTHAPPSGLRPLFQQTSKLPTPCRNTPPHHRTPPDLLFPGSANVPRTSSLIPERVRHGPTASFPAIRTSQIYE